MEILRRKLVFYKSMLIFIVFGLLIALVPANVYLFWNGTIKEDQRQKKVPYYREVMRIIKPLKYSGLHIFVQKDVTLTMDFEKKEYTLHNVHKFAPDGRIILAEGRYGLCGELSAYVYQKIKSIFADGYSIKFLRVLESGYFFMPKSSHIVLLLNKKGRDGGRDEEFIIDPSFHRYGRIEDYDNYLFIEVVEDLNFEKEHYTDITWQVNAGAPILIKDDQIVVLSINEIEGKFDRDNFQISVVTARKNKYVNHSLFSLICRQGKCVQQTENELTAEYLLTPNGYHELTQKMLEWFKSIKMLEPKST